MNINKSRKNLKIFCDFDGTITIKDLGDEVFKVFGEFEPFHTQLVSGEINIKKYWNLMVPTIKDLPESKIEEFALNSEIDPYFEKFLEICKKNDYPITIVSDGFSSYIKPILKKLDSDDMPTYCNFIDFSNIPKPFFPGASESCNCLCASCKRNVILNNTGDDDLTVYIGDGYSDYCAAEHCDIVFAKRNLAVYCSKNRIPFHNFKTFFDINLIIEKYIAGKIHFRKSRQAELKRKSAYQIE